LERNRSSRLFHYFVKINKIFGQNLFYEVLRQLILLQVLRKEERKPRKGIHKKNTYYYLTGSMEWRITISKILNGPWRKRMEGRIKKMDILIQMEIIPLWEKYADLREKSIIFFNFFSEFLTNPNSIACIGHGNLYYELFSIIGKYKKILTKKVKDNQHLNKEFLKKINYLTRFRYKTNGFVDIWLELLDELALELIFTEFYKLDGAFFQRPTKKPFHGTLF